MRPTATPSAPSAPSAPTRHTRRGAALVIAGSLLGLGAFLWPLWSRPSGTVDAAHLGDAPWLLAILTPLLLATAAAEVGRGALDAKGVAALGVLAAAGSALRLPTGGIAGTEMVFFLLLPAARVFGVAFGYLLGAITIFASAILTGGLGPWLPFQMLGAAWIGAGAGLLPKATGRAEPVLLAAYGAVASLAYGALLNLWFWPFVAGDGTAVSFVPGDAVVANLRRFWGFHLATSLGWDVVRAATTVVLCMSLGRPMIGALTRVRRRAAFGAIATFEP